MSKNYTTTHLHEALDRTSNVLDIIERQLVSHKVFKKNKKYKKRITHISEKMAELYQLLGVDVFNTPENISFVDEISLAAPGVRAAVSDILARRAKEQGLPVTDVKLAPADPIGTDGPTASLQSVIIYSANMKFPEYLTESVVRQLSDSMFICRLTPEQYIEASIDVSLHVADYSIEESNR